MVKCPRCGGIGEKIRTPYGPQPNIWGCTSCRRLFSRHKDQDNKVETNSLIYFKLGHDKYYTIDDFKN